MRLALGVRNGKAVFTPRVHITHQVTNSGKASFLMIYDIKRATREKEGAFNYFKRDIEIRIRHFAAR
jgi:hypothetical protein